MAKESYCCEMMENKLRESCPTHGRNCPDIVMSRLTKGPGAGRFGIPVHDGGSSVVVIDYCPWCGKDLRIPVAPALKIVRLHDMMDGWIDITGPVTEEEAMRIWNEKTGNGTHNFQYDHGDYYDVFPADTSMLVTPEFLGR